MKRYFKFLIITLSVAITLFSCQEEESEVITNPDNLTNASTLKKKMARIAQNTTSDDNVIDSTSCFKINLPVGVVVNNQMVTISDATGYATVENIINEFDGDDDTISFIYPITITYTDYTTQTITNSSQLEDIIDQCGEDNPDEVEIECVNIVYPITFSFYDAGSQTPNSVTISNDVQLFNFLDDFDSNDYATLNYPITITDGSNQQTIINSNAALESAITQLGNSCNDDDDIDDDDNDPSDDDPISPNITGMLYTGSWRVTYYFDDENETSDYFGYNFAFNQNGTITILGNGLALTGTWIGYEDDGQNVLDLTFTSSQLNDLSDDWEIIEITPTTLRLKDVSGGNGETDYLTFTRN